MMAIERMRRMKNSIYEIVSGFAVPPTAEPKEARPIRSLVRIAVKTLERSSPVAMSLDFLIIIRPMTAYIAPMTIPKNIAVLVYPALILRYDSISFSYCCLFLSSWAADFCWFSNNARHSFDFCWSGVALQLSGIGADTGLEGY